MIVERQCQMITSRFGNRKLKGKANFHKGIDLRTWNLKNYTQQNILSPERIKIIDIWENEKWGQGISFEFLDSNMFDVGVYRHIKIITGVEIGMEFNTGDVIGQSMTTKYMKRMGFTHHLHFEVHVNCRVVNPILYLDFKKINYKYKWSV